ncbi:MAG: hypothetical protein H0W49_02870 [Nitrospirales bacterium]|nr:hypothetical protein [Nitrospirales bacterium]
MFKTFTDNPVPTALVGFGLYWLWKDSSDGSEGPGQCFRAKSTPGSNQEFGGPSVEDQVKEKFQTAKDTVQESLTDLKDQASHQALKWKEETTGQALAWKEGSQQKIEEGKRYLQKQATAARGEFNHLVDSNPLAVGAVMLALGTAVAAALPGTRKEDQWMGESRDKITDAVKSTVQTTVEDVKQTTGKVAEKVLQEGERQAP